MREQNVWRNALVCPRTDSATTVIVLTHNLFSKCYQCNQNKVAIVLAHQVVILSPSSLSYIDAWKLLVSSFKMLQSLIYLIQYQKIK